MVKIMMKMTKTPNKHENTEVLKGREKGGRRWRWKKEKKEEVEVEEEKEGGSGREGG